MSGEPLLSVDGLSTWIGAGDDVVRAVDQVSFEIRKGETFALVGESGCGKSMTALSIMRLLPDGAGIVGGGVHFGGRDLASLPEREMREVRGRRIAMIFQEPATSLNPVLPVGRQVEEVLVRHAGLRGGAARARVQELFESVGIPDAVRRLDEYPFQLSGGLRQRVMIAIALACEPDLLIADEPTTALDVTIQAQVLDLLAELQRRTGMAMLLITHDLAVVAQMSARVAVMYAGQIVESARTRRFLDKPGHPYARMLLRALPGTDARSGRLASIPGAIPDLRQTFAGCRFAPRCDRVVEACRQSTQTLGAVGDGWEVRCSRVEAATVGQGASPAMPAAPATSRSTGGRQSAAPLLDVQGLQVHFPVKRGLLRRTAAMVRAVDGVDLRLEAGTTVALVGESGCGKTTVGKSIVQLIRPTAGRVVFAGTDLCGLDEQRLARLRKGFQMVFQDPFSSLDPRMRVNEILEEGMVALCPEIGAIERSRRIDSLLERVGLGVAAKGRYPHEFSGGQRQRIAIARALAVEPKVLVCDEPTSALDVSVQAQILNLLKDIQEEMGLAYLFITHNLSVVEYLADEVAVMYLGRIVEQGTAREVLSSPVHPYTQALLAAVPRINSSASRQGRLAGDPPSPTAPPVGCHFQPRCPHATDTCRRDYPASRQVSSTHSVHCILDRPRSAG